MYIMQLVLWFIYPYMVAMIMAVGYIWKCDFSIIYKENKFFLILYYTLHIVLRILLLLAIFTGLAGLLNNGFGNYFLSLFQWGISFISFQPEIEFIKGMSIFTQIHMLIIFTFFLMYTFTFFVKRSNE